MNIIQSENLTKKLDDFNVVDNVFIHDRTGNLWIFGIEQSRIDYNNQASSWDDKSQFRLNFASWAID